IPNANGGDGSDIGAVELDATPTPTPTPTPVPTPTPTPSDVLFISEYIEGTSSHKAIEIFNSGSTLVDLASEGYRLEIYANGSLTATGALDLVGLVAAG